jgi:RHS repeat-associated protein
VHEDAITKSQRTTDVNGNVTPNGVVELDPWGANTARSSPTVFQPQTFTGYTRDANGDSDARARRYSPTGRFPQPDPSGGSYDLSNPQSLNRYAYVGNDPVNFRDPSGAEPNETFCGATYGWNMCGGGRGFWGGYFGNHVAEYNSEYGGLSPNIADAQHLHNQRVDNALGGLGFLTSAEVRMIEAHAYLQDPITGHWTPFENGDAVWAVADGSSFSILNAAKRVAWSIYDMNTPDGVQFNGNLIWVFGVNVTLTKDLDLFGGVETPNVSELVRTGLKSASHGRISPVSASLTQVVILAPNVQRAERQRFFGGSSFNISGGWDGIVGGYSRSGGMNGIGVGVGSPGINVGSSVAWPIFTRP